MLRLQTSLNRRGFPCPRCARTFHTSGGMSRHYRLECVDLPRFKCPHCDMRSKYTQAVYRHIRAKHRNMELRFVKLYWENKKKREGERNNNNNPRYNVTLRPRRSFIPAPRQPILRVFSLSHRHERQGPTLKVHSRTRYVRFALFSSLFNEGRNNSNERQRERESEREWKL